MICSGETSNLAFTPARSMRVAHGVDQRDVLVHQLRHVLVTGGDQHRLAGIGRAPSDSAMTSSASTPEMRSSGRPWRSRRHTVARFASAGRPGMGGRCALYSANSSSRKVFRRVEYHHHGSACPRGTAGSCAACRARGTRHCASWPAAQGVKRPVKRRAVDQDERSGAHLGVTRTGYFGAGVPAADSRFRAASASTHAAQSAGAAVAAGAVAASGPLLTTSPSLSGR